MYCTIPTYVCPFPLYYRMFVKFYSTSSSCFNKEEWIRYVVPAVGSCYWHWRWPVTTAWWRPRRRAPNATTPLFRMGNVTCITTSKCETLQWEEMEAIKIMRLKGNIGTFYIVEYYFRLLSFSTFCVCYFAKSLRNTSIIELAVISLGIICC